MNQYTTMQASVPQEPAKGEAVTTSMLVHLAFQHGAQLMRDAAIVEADPASTATVLVAEGRVMPIYGRQPEAAQAWLGGLVIREYMQVPSPAVVSRAIATLNAMAAAKVTTPTVRVVHGSYALGADSNRYYRTESGYVAVSESGRVTELDDEPDIAQTGLFFAPLVKQPGGRRAFPAYNPDADTNLARRQFQYLAIEDGERQSEALTALTAFRLFYPRTPGYANAIGGMAGGGKTTLSEALAQPLDPRWPADAASESAPHAGRYNLNDPKEFAFAVEGQDVLVLDNVDSEIMAASDMLASAITGGSQLIEVKYSNSAKSINLCRPTIVNGLSVGGKADLITRFFPTQISTDKPTPLNILPGESFASWMESAFALNWQAIFNLMCAAARVLPTVEVEAGRFQACRRFLAACDKLMGWHSLETVIKATEAFQAERSADSPIVAVMTAHAEALEDWCGSTSELLALLGQDAFREAGMSKGVTAHALSRLLALEGENLRRAGWVLFKTTAKGKTQWHITPPRDLDGTAFAGFEI